MTETTVYFVRHGQTYFNRYNRMQGWADSPLTEQGILDADKVGQRLAQIKFDQAYCSDTGRARSTARLILKKNTVSELTEPLETPFFREEFYVVSGHCRSGRHRRGGRSHSEENRSVPATVFRPVLMIGKLRLAGAGLILFLVVAVDFTSRIMSTVADGFLVVALLVVIWPVISKKS